LDNGNKSAQVSRLRDLLPHRYPFLLVDRVLEFDHEHARTLKNVTINEPFFVGHFPANPVMPGVLIVEALAQSAAILALGQIEARPLPLFVLAGIDKVRFRRPVVPGDTLEMEVKLLKHHRPLWKVRGEARVGGELVAEAEISAMEVRQETQP